jgi:hypothetical protein
MARRAPAAYEHVRSALLPRADADRLAQVESDYLNALAQIDALREQVEVEFDLRINAISDLEETERELAEKTDRIAYLDRVVARSEVTDDAWAQAGEGPALAAPETPTEAVEMARLHLAGLVIPASASDRTAELDAALESRVWGETIWRALRALDAYVKDAGEYSGFWNWCAESGHAYSWPATSKKLAMKESDTAMNAYGGDRRFRVASELHRDGFLTMQSHIKVAEGGGQLSPRIYFHDDTGGTTGRIHVGFVGPHRYVRNGSTN